MMNLGPLATANGTLRARIIDAQLGFDADVTVPLRYGQIDFDDVTVEHVGPDSRMGASPQGLYVDAPTGRSYLYQFPSTPVAGVEFEKRAALLSPLVSDRGKLHVQAFVEGLLGSAGGGHALGLTPEARALLGRTSVTGDLQLADGKFEVQGVQGELVGHAEGRNVVRISSGAVASGLRVEMASLSVRNVLLDVEGKQAACDEVTGAIVVNVVMENGQWRLAADLENVKASGLRLLAV